jgi:hypothetical protein
MVLITFLNLNRYRFDLCCHLQLYDGKNVRLVQSNVLIRLISCLVVSDAFYKLDVKKYCHTTSRDECLHFLNAQKDSATALYSILYTVYSTQYTWYMQGCV